MSERKHYIKTTELRKHAKEKRKQCITTEHNAREKQERGRGKEIKKYKETKLNNVTVLRISTKSKDQRKERPMQENKSQEKHMKE